MSFEYDFAELAREAHEWMRAAGIELAAWEALSGADQAERINQVMEIYEGRAQDPDPQLSKLVAQRRSRI